MKVLIIDDDADIRSIARLSLSRVGGMDVIEAANGVEGVRKAREEQPDVILLDMMMPGVGGHEVLARLGAEESTAKIPVIVVTSHFLNEDERRQILSRAAAVILRAELSQDVVTSAIDSALRR